LVIGAAALSGNRLPTSGELRIQSEDRNPWTHLRLNNGPATFRFAIVSDRTGGHRARIFSEAVEQLNLLQPEFVLCVGDLIEGYTSEDKKLNKQWKEFQTYVSRLQMPFFYLPGNHDMANKAEARQWQERFGRSYYHFVYRDVLFLMLNSDDPPSSGRISKEQQDWVAKTLADNANVRWTMVALHRPIWTAKDLEKNGWGPVEKALGQRPYTVFAGHIHRYQKYTRNGRHYYQLATTGGGSRLRGVRYGEFDHITWITMKQDGPVLANILLDGIYPEDLKRTVTDEKGVAVDRKSTYPVKGWVYYDGCPAPGAQVVFYYINPATSLLTRAGDALVDGDGSFTLSTYQANDGAPAGKYGVAVTWRENLFDPDGTVGANRLPEKYATVATSGLRVEVRPGQNEFTLELRK
jgi:3',5'-cyclic AMP phosphodiesterase CpdA